MRQPPVQVAPAGQAYTSLGGELLPLDLESGQITGDAVAHGETRAADAQGERTAEVLRAAAPRPPASRTQAAPVATGPRAVVAAAKARIRELRAELKRHAALRKELAELERLVAAAKARPSATNVRELRRSG